MEKKYKCSVAYDGTAYAGSQIQPNERTIQGEIEAVLAQLHKGQVVKITMSGRTDAGVHAQAQVFHFQSELVIPVQNWLKALNSLLPRDIRIREVQEVPLDFHARFDALSKEYRYFIYNGQWEDPFRRLYSYHYPDPFDLGQMQEVGQVLVGQHDFGAFTSAKSEVRDKVRTIYALNCQQVEEELVISVVGNGFLYNMVRIIVGTLLEVGQGKRSRGEVEAALKNGERELVGKTAPPHGLFLWSVDYP